MGVNPIQLQKSLKGLGYPADKQSIMKKAKENKADENVSVFLERIPDKQYTRPTDISREISKIK